MKKYYVAFNTLDRTRGIIATGTGFLFFNLETEQGIIEAVNYLEGEANPPPGGSCQIVFYHRLDEEAK